MSIWLHWWNVVNELRPACSRMRSFMWLAASLAGICIRSDLAGVSSIVRALGLREEYYDRLLDFFHSHAIDVDHLARLWTRLVFRFFPKVARVNDRVVLLADGIKIPKADRKMPGVKLLHQESDSNTKPEYIMGHSCQAVSVVVNAGSSAFAVPLAVRIHAGLIFSNRCKRKLTDKMVSLIQMTGITLPFYLVADAYYACKVVDLPLIEAKSPVYRETGVVIRYLQIDLIWKPLHRLVRFVVVDHPVRGKCLLMSTDLTLGAIDIIALYGIRFKIEVSFKSALRTLGGWGASRVTEERAIEMLRDRRDSNSRPPA